MISSVGIPTGARIQLRKAHPCGSRWWLVTQPGADMRLTCAGCGRRVLLDRAEFERRLTAVEPPASGDAS
ncbi:MAG: DUF951 domain-containing protein [Armatimonadetes bacterium]|nr:DUF951 domain-containing protein [Armatimonadota bacterium]MDE2206035.1 DUF951 domain-containing protein [Armatimonadota bacterium]